MLANSVDLDQTSDLLFAEVPIMGRQAQEN